MPKRPGIKKVMIIGSGPIVIGQACEFDYSGTQACKALRALGYLSELLAMLTEPSSERQFLMYEALACERINKLNESRPNIVDAIMSREIQMVINTPMGRWSKVDDSYIRKNAIRFQVPYMTTIPAALASVKGIAAQRKSRSGVRSLQDYHRGLG